MKCDAVVLIRKIIPKILCLRIKASYPRHGHTLLLTQVDSGSLSLVSTNDAAGWGGSDFDFLSATFGTTLPLGQVALVSALPIDACSPLQVPPALAINKAAATEHGAIYIGAAVLVRRGGCGFGVKAKHVQVNTTAQTGPAIEGTRKLGQDSMPQALGC